MSTETHLVLLNGCITRDWWRVQGIHFPKGFAGDPMLMKESQSNFAWVYSGDKALTPSHQSLQDTLPSI